MEVFRNQFVCVCHHFNMYTLLHARHHIRIHFLMVAFHIFCNSPIKKIHTGDVIYNFGLPTLEMSVIYIHRPQLSVLTIPVSLCLEILGMGFRVVRSNVMAPNSLILVQCTVACCTVLHHYMS